MNTDIRLSVGFWEHPKTVKLIRRLGLEGVRSLQVLWLWATQNRPDGVLSSMDAEDIEIAAKWSGEPTALYTVLTELRFIDTTNASDDSCQVVNLLHGWAEHNSWQADSETRSGESRLKRLARSYPDVHKALQEAGCKAITGDEYQLVQQLYRSNTAVDTIVVQISTGRSTPFPSLPFHTKPKPKDRKQVAPNPDGFRAESGTLVCNKSLARERTTKKDPPPRDDLTAYYLPVKSPDMREVAYLKAENWKTWVDTYGESFCMTCLNGAYSWALSNPAKAKTVSGVHAYFNNWLKNEQNKPGGSRASPPAAQGTLTRNMETTAAVLAARQQRRQGT